MSSSTSSIECNGEKIYVTVFYEPNEADLCAIKLYGQKRSWIGSLSRLDSEKNRERLEETEEDYLENIKKALSSNPDFVQDFQVKHNDCHSAVLSWSKKFTSAVILHGSVTVQEQESESKEQLLDFLLHENQALKRNLDSMELKNKDLHLQLENCAKSLEEAVDSKKNLEETLYGKFVQVLNTKKRRIQLLEDSMSKISKTC